MCKLYTSFTSFFLYLSSQSPFFLLLFSPSTSQDDQHILKWLPFDLLLSYAPYLFQGCRLFCISELFEKNIVWELTFFQACWKGFCNMAWEYINVIQHVFDKEDIWTFAIYCTVHGNLFSFFLTFKLNSTAKYWNHVAIVRCLQ